MNNVANIFDPDRLHIERLTSELDRVTAELMDYMNRRHSREAIGKDMYRLALSEIRLATIRGDFGYDAGNSNQA